MIEVEMKFLLVETDAFLRRLAELQPTLVEDRMEIDEYFQAPDRDFAVTDEALRVRRVGQTAYLTYKGPKLDAVTKTRKELEVRLQDGLLAADLAVSLLHASGYSTAANVTKSRKVFCVGLDHLQAEVCLDRVQDLGDFVEIEIAADVSSVEKARQAVGVLAERLELGPGERRSYLELLLDRQKGD